MPHNSSCFVFDWSPTFFWVQASKLVEPFNCLYIPSLAINGQYQLRQADFVGSRWLLNIWKRVRHNNSFPKCFSSTQNSKFFERIYEPILPRMAQRGKWINWVLNNWFTFRIWIETKIASVFQFIFFSRIGQPEMFPERFGYGTRGSVVVSVNGNWGL